MFEHVKSIFYPKSRSRSGSVGPIIGSPPPSDPYLNDSNNHSPPSLSNTHQHFQKRRLSNYSSPAANTESPTTTNISPSPSSSSRSSTPSSTTNNINNNNSPQTTSGITSLLSASGSISSGNNSPVSPRRNAVIQLNNRKTINISSGSGSSLSKSSNHHRLSTREIYTTSSLEHQQQQQVKPSELTLSLNSNNTNSNNTIVTTSSNRNNLKPYIIVTLKSGEDLIPCDRNGKSDPFCVFHYRYLEQHQENELNQQAAVAALLKGGGYLEETKKSKCLKKTLNPMWDESFFFSVRNVEQNGSDELFIGAIQDELIVNVWDFDLFQSNDFMGSVSVPLSQLLKNQTQKFYLKLEGVPNGFIFLEITAQNCGLDLGDEFFAVNSTTTTTNNSNNNSLVGIDSKSEDVHSRTSIVHRDVSNVISSGESLNNRFKVDQFVTTINSNNNNSSRSGGSILRKLFQELEKNPKKDYELIQPLGEGSYGIVFSALKTLVGTEELIGNGNNNNSSSRNEMVALKKVKIDNLQSAQEILYEIELIQYLDEGELCKWPFIVHHNNIFLESVNRSNKENENDEMTICFEMPLFSQGDLHKFLESKSRKGKKIHISTFVSYLKQLAETLALLHHPDFRASHTTTKSSSSLTSSNHDDHSNQSSPTPQSPPLAVVLVPGGEGGKEGEKASYCHRDIKPQNIFIADDYQTLKLADFSFLIRINSNKNEEGNNNSSGMDGMKNTKLCGSIPHMAPELYLQMNSDSLAISPSGSSSGSNSGGEEKLIEELELLRKTDVFSLGVIAYQLLTFDTKIDHTFYQRIMPGGINFGGKLTNKKKQKEKFTDFVDELEFEISKMISLANNEEEYVLIEPIKNVILSCLKWNPKERISSLELLESLRKIEELVLKV